MLRSAAKNHQSLKEFVHEYLSFRGRCRRHCDKSTSLIELWYDTINMVGAYVCPSGYVSRVIYFSRDPDIQWFKQFLSTQAGGEMLNDRDLRPATRHGWELGSDVITNNTTTSSSVVSEVYWTTYPKTDKERRRGLFLCSEPQKEKGCKILFVQDISSSHRLCQKCR